MSQPTREYCGSWQAAQHLRYSWRFSVTARKEPHSKSWHFAELFKSRSFGRGGDGERCISVPFRVSVWVCLFLLKDKSRWAEWLPSCSSCRTEEREQRAKQQAGSHIEILATVTAHLIYYR